MLGLLTEVGNVSCSDEMSEYSWFGPLTCKLTFVCESLDSHSNNICGSYGLRLKIDQDFTKDICFPGHVYNTNVTNSFEITFWHLHYEEGLNISCYFWCSNSHEELDPPEVHVASRKSKNLMEALV